MEHRCLSPWRGAVAGGLIVFAWSVFSWMVLPFHGRAIAPFADPATTALGLLLQMTGAFFWTWILGKIPGLTIRDSALYGLFFGLCIGALGILPGSVYWNLPLSFTAMHVVDAAIAWTAATMVLSRCYAPVCALPKRP